MTLTLAALSIAEPAKALGLTLPDNLGVKDWTDIGTDLAASQQSLNWQIADWFAFGRDRYSEAQLAEVEKLPLFSGQRKELDAAAKVAKAFAPADRDASLSFKHYAYLVDLPHGAAKQILKKAKAESWTPKQLEAAKAQTELALSGDASGGNAIGQLALPAHADPEHDEYVAIARAWNRARPSARQMFADVVDIDALALIEDI